MIRNTPKESPNTFNNDSKILDNIQDQNSTIRGKTNSSNKKNQFDSSLNYTDNFDNIYQAEVIPNDTSNKNIFYLHNLNRNEKQLTTKFLHLIKEEHFEFGYSSLSEKLVGEQLAQNSLFTRNWLNKMFLTYFSQETIIIGILRIIAHFDTTDIYPQGQTMAIAGLSHQSDEIKELSVRAFEQWADDNSIMILKNLKVETQWLQDYINQIIKDLE